MYQKKGYRFVVIHSARLLYAEMARPSDIMSIAEFGQRLPRTISKQTDVRNLRADHVGVLLIGLVHSSVLLWT
jgi:hypothetical protein